jgi:hypothetical protein
MARDREMLIAQALADIAPTVSRCREAIVEMRVAQAIPPAEFPGHSGVYLATLEGYLGSRVPALLACIERIERIMLEGDDAET